jgi:hypothetical protein
MHYRGLLRIAAAKAACACTPRANRAAAMRPTAAAPWIALVDVVVRQVRAAARPCLGHLLVSLLRRYGAPQWVADRARRAGARPRRLPRPGSMASTGTGPRARHPARGAAWPDERVRLLAPFDPVVWDRRRFEPSGAGPTASRPTRRRRERVRGYYALPLLWRDQVIGWGNGRARMRSRKASTLATPTAWAK